MINMRSIEKLYKEGKIYLEDDFFGVSMCRIGNYNFYFGDWGDDLSTEEVKEKLTEKEIIREIHKVIKTEKNAEFCGMTLDEYHYYEDFIAENYDDVSQMHMEMRREFAW